MARRSPFLYTDWSMNLQNKAISTTKRGNKWCAVKAVILCTVINVLSLTHLYLQFSFIYSQKQISLDYVI